MSHLLSYLNGNHATTKLEDMEVQFMEEFGVNVRNEDDLFQFKYNQLVAKWLRPETWECRGCILRRTNVTWKFVARPFDKFFNQHEGHSGVHEKAVFDANIKRYALIEKLDGTNISMWFDSKIGVWRISTLGAITTKNVGDYNITFADLFWKTTGDKISFVNKLSDFDKLYTFIFELCCNENRIVTKYKKNKIVLLGIRNLETGEYVS